MNRYTSKHHSAYIHGHAPSDYIYRDRLFLIISVGCAKCEDMQEKKAPGFVTEKRELGTITQERWDTLIISPDKKRLDLVRFGT